MTSLEARLAKLEKSGAASRLHVIVLRRHETNAQARLRMGSPAFVVIVPEKDVPDRACGDKT